MNWYRVSFYRKSEVVAGRAPRYMVEIEAESVKDAQKQILEKEPNAVIRSAYKTPNTPIRETPSYVFLTEDARNKWYSSHKSTTKERLCHECSKNPVEHYKRICKECREKRETAATEKPCALCQKPIATPSRRRYCDECSAKRKESQEKFHREKRAKQTTIERIREQIAWADKKLKTTTKPSCKLAHRFQGLRIPHYSNKANRCRTCLQKFIDVQTVYLANLMAGEQQEAANAAFMSSILETEEHAHGHAAGI